LRRAARLAREGAQGEMTVVLDASIAAAGLLPEEDSNAADVVYSRSSMRLDVGPPDGRRLSGCGRTKAEGAGSTRSGTRSQTCR
jgi:hypothetical protein